MKILVIGARGMLAKPAIKQLDNHGCKLRLFSRTVNNSMFEKVKAPPYNSETDSILGKAEMNLEKWINTQK